MKIYNSKTNKLEQFIPKNEKQINMYVCGPTVYSDIHIGNARPIIFFDVVARFMEAIGYSVNYVSNITDVDDKIIRKAHELNISEEELVTETTNEFLKVLNTLNIRKYDIQPKVTEYMQEIIAFIDLLIKKDAAYEVDGDVYFRVNKINQYGEISNRKFDELIDGARVEINDKKENPQDFTLWKKTDHGVKWDTKWSQGRPGWHTECVVMIRSIFKQTIDIHGGGMDLKFPHHENENAQSCACNKELANYWMHNGFINIDNTKMSKSLGNVFNTKDFLEQHGSNVLRIMMLQTNYRQPINITEEFIKQTKKIDKKFEMINDKIDNDKRLMFNKIIEEFNEIMKNDFNTANAITYLIQNTKNINELEVQDLFAYAFEVLGLKYQSEEIPEAVKVLIKARTGAKKNKEFQKADEIRAKISQAGYEILDTREGVQCKKIKN